MRPYLVAIFFALIPTRMALALAPEGKMGSWLVNNKLENIGNAFGVPTDGRAADPVGIAGLIVRAALTLIGLIFLILTVYGGSLYLTAGGNEETVKKAKNIIVRAMIGVLIVVFAGAITQFIVSQIQSPGGTDACTPGDSYPAEFIGIDYGCDRQGYTLTGTTCECH